MNSMTGIQFLMSSKIILIFKRDDAYIAFHFSIVEKNESCKEDSNA